ncbi:transmembrane protease serine 4 [Trichonephila clavata]|uniref:Transmembrane protease serine 4 n=1 Tax=Trichonephila clavata TaxID=2740835 RepID=A0A8X6EZP3_TRICU|nr:transmembrane protease serine 4 [Trichonephila clavata]
MNKEMFALLLGFIFSGVQGYNYYQNYGYGPYQYSYKYNIPPYNNDNNFPAYQVAYSSSNDCGKANEVNPFIIGGSEVYPHHKYPWMVAIKNENSAFKCGGSLITPQYVLTAAHCLIETGNVIVGIGAHNLTIPHEEIRSRKIKMHPRFNLTLQIHDIALIMLEKPVTLSENIGTICLPYDRKLEKPGTKAVVAGWGLLSKEGKSSQVLMEATFKVIPGSESAIVTEGENPGKGTGIGDSGSPLFVRYPNERWYVIGVVSSEVDTKTFFPKVLFYLSWIQENIQDGAMCELNA